MRMDEKEMLPDISVLVVGLVSFSGSASDVPTGEREEKVADVIVSVKSFCCGECNEMMVYLTWERVVVWLLLLKVVDLLPKVAVKFVASENKCVGKVLS